MIERNGNVFDTDAKYIGHGVNCVGVMGAGIAKTVRENYPQVYKEYKAVCEAGALKPGKFFVYGENGKLIVNLATQNMPGPDARYGWVFDALYGFADRAAEVTDKHGGLVAIPEIGCGIGGLEIDKVKRIITTVEFLVPQIEFEVWHYK